MRKWFLQPILEILRPALVNLADSLKALWATEGAHAKLLNDLDTRQVHQHKEILNELHETQEQLQRLRVMIVEHDLGFQEAIHRVAKAAEFYCNMHEYDAAKYAVSKTLGDTQFCQKATPGEQIEESAHWAAAYLAEHGIKHVNTDMMRGLVRARWEQETKEKK